MIHHLLQSQQQIQSTGRRPLNPGQVLAHFKHATELLFRRKLPADQHPHQEPALGVECAMPGLEVSDSTWDDWEALINGSSQAAAVDLTPERERREGVGGNA